jgi:hypothetical protein
MQNTAKLLVISADMSLKYIENSEHDSSVMNSLLRSDGSMRVVVGAGNFQYLSLQSTRLFDGI